MKIFEELTEFIVFASLIVSGMWVFYWLLASALKIVDWIVG